LLLSERYGLTRYNSAKAVGESHTSVTVTSLFVWQHLRFLCWIFVLKFVYSEVLNLQNEDRDLVLQFFDLSFLG
jgi:hypothetical protein